jgi:hypothetical protein
MQLPGQLGPAGGTANMANPKVTIVKIVTAIDEYNPTLTVEGLEFSIILYH